MFRYKEKLGLFVGTCFCSCFLIFVPILSQTQADHPQLRGRTDTVIKKNAPVFNEVIYNTMKGVATSLQHRNDSMKKIGYSLRGEIRRQKKLIAHYRRIINKKSPENMTSVLFQHIVTDSVTENSDSLNEIDLPKPIDKTTFFERVFKKHKKHKKQN